VGADLAVPLLEWPEAPSLGAAVAVTTRHGGLSDRPYESLNLGLHVGDDPSKVVTNRERAAGVFGVDLGTVVFAQQVHGAGATVVGPSEGGRGTRQMEDALASTDILVTADAGVTLAILVADCVPLALLDPDARVLAAVHAGWRGTALGAVARAVEAMSRLGARPERMAAFLGPAVAPARYQVDDVVHRALSDAVAPHPLGAGVAEQDGPGHWRVDLIAANRQQLELAGVAPSRIFDSGCSTADDDFFSDRAARPCGRFGLLARLEAPGRSM
jgi:polyphenol oxidase